METARTLVLIAATITAGLISGLFYAFTVAVMPGLARSTDKTTVETMQNINKAILNGWFMLAYLGAPLFITAALVLHATDPDTRNAVPPLAAALGTCLAAMIITARVNIPLNNALEEAGPPEHHTDPTTTHTTRTTYETPWNRANTWRTVLTTLTLALLAYTLVLD
ncbi:MULTISPECIES: anthrone oxygenase family protein [unclassified Streptomyces]|uniref:anthrone oxygenase family protein n=1 Tax=unclassified Streptomyces TaxID=2593676 RepID=UPI002E281E98|nr:anthrone oxygenase family protein [Streptomyces sp. NBC_01439]